MLPGVHTNNPPRDCMFPWTIPDQADTKADRVPSTPVSRGGSPAPEQPTDPKPIAYRAWSLEHAGELDAG